MSWEPLPTDYTDAVWDGLKKYNQISNSDGTVSFQDMTVYINKEKSFFGANDANRINSAINNLMSDDLRITPQITYDHATTTPDTIIQDSTTNIDLTYMENLIFSVKFTVAPDNIILGDGSSGQINYYKFQLSDDSYPVYIRHSGGIYTKCNPADLYNMYDSSNYRLNDILCKCFTSPMGKSILILESAPLNNIGVIPQIALRTYTSSGSNIYYYDSSSNTTKTRLDFKENSLFTAQLKTYPSSSNNYTKVYFRIAVSGTSSNTVDYPVYIKNISGRYIACESKDLYEMFNYSPSGLNDIMCKFFMNGTEKCVLLVDSITTLDGIPIKNGGTGATTPVQALKNLEQDTGWKTLRLSSSSYKTADNLSFQYRKRGSKVTLRGNINPQGSGFKVGTEYVVATLPSGYRPQRPFYYIGAANGVSYTRWYINADGEVRYVFHSGSSTSGAAPSTNWASIWVEFDVD